VRAGLLRPRQRRLPRLGRHQPRPRRVPPVARGGGRVITPDELMSVAAARSLRDGQSCFVGIGLPSTAANLARRLHAPNLVLIYESGAVDSRPAELPRSIGDGVVARSALSVVSVPEVFNYWL